MKHIENLVLTNKYQHQNAFWCAQCWHQNVFWCQNLAFSAQLVINEKPDLGPVLLGGNAFCHSRPATEKPGRNPKTCFGVVFSMPKTCFHSILWMSRKQNRTQNTFPVLLSCGVKPREMFKTRFQTILSMSRMQNRPQNVFWSSIFSVQNVFSTYFVNEQEAKQDPKHVSDSFKLRGQTSWDVQNAFPKCFVNEQEAKQSPKHVSG